MRVSLFRLIKNCDPKMLPIGGSDGSRSYMSRWNPLRVIRIDIWSALLPAAPTLSLSAGTHFLEELTASGGLELASM